MPVKRPTNALTLRSREHLPINILLYMCLMLLYCVLMLPYSARVEAIYLPTQYYYVSLLCYICVLMPLYMCVISTTIMYPYAVIYVSSCCFLCCYICVLMLRLQVGMARGIAHYKEYVANVVRAMGENDEE